MSKLNCGPSVGRLRTDMILGPTTFRRKELHPTDSESSSLPRARPIRQRLGFLRHPSVALPNPASFASDRVESGVLTALVFDQNEAQPRCGLMRSTF